jgi:hypothetical protein
VRVSRAARSQGRSDRGLKELEPLCDYPKLFAGFAQGFFFLQKYQKTI